MLDCHLNLVWEQLEEVRHPKETEKKIFKKFQNRFLAAKNSAAFNFFNVIFLSWRKISDDDLQALAQFFFSGARIFLGEEEKEVVRSSSNSQACKPKK